MASSPEETQQKKVLILKLSDNDEFEIEKSITIQFETIKDMVENDYSPILLPNVDTQTLVEIIEYIKKHAEKTDSNEKEIEDFDKDFVKKSFENLFNLTVAAHYLEINDLLDLLCMSIADRIKNKSMNAIEKIFHITNDFTPEEKEKARKENPWVFEEELDDSLD